MSDLELHDRWRSSADAVRREISALRRKLKTAVFPDANDVRRRAHASALVLPSSDHPRVSIVIPVFGKFEHTWSCLASIARTPEATPYEVIVVDDASRDETPAILSTVRGVVVVRNASNLGFVASCNVGAEKARGEFVCFLNNDTDVTRGWLDEIVATFEREPDAGLVGARLLYPDGRLQECGGVVFGDGSAANQGKFDDPDRPEHGYLREVDYCSGACIALRAALFRSLGGFDARFSPAYYEDTDLAFRVREVAKQKCFVQPHAQVVHFEGATNGTDTREGIKRHQVTNRETFVARWSEVLRRPRVARPRLLFVDHHVPRPDHDSGSLRSFELMRLLRREGVHVTFVANHLFDAERYIADLQKNGVEILYPPYVVSPRHALRLHGHELDGVVLTRADNVSLHLEAVRRRAPRAKVIFDTVDLHHVREAREAELSNDEAKRARARRREAQEVWATNACDLTLTVSEAEKQTLQRACPDAEILVLSNIHQEHASRAPFSARRDFLFLGGFRHPPNVDAAIHFVREIMPKLRSRLPRDATFFIVGSEPPHEVRALAGEGVVVTGQVGDLSPWFEHARLSVAPLRYGAGVKGKVNMSMAYGVPVVATSCAVEGMGLRDGHDVVVADGARAFADAIVALWNDEARWHELARNARKTLRERFSRESATDAVRALKRTLAR